MQLSNLQHEYAALKQSHDDLEKSLDQARKSQEQAQSKANKLAQQYGDLSDGQCISINTAEATATNY